MPNVEFSSMYSNPGGYIKVYPPMTPINVDALDGQSLCLNNDFEEKYLSRPYVKVRKTHDLPLNKNGFSFFTNFKTSPTSLNFKFFSVDGLNENTAITSVVTALEENYFITVTVGAIQNYTQNIGVLYTDGGNVVGITPTFVMTPLDDKNAVRIRYRSIRGKVQNFPYIYDTEDRVNSVLVFANMKGYEYPEELTTYSEVTTGRTRKTNSLLQRTVILETYYLDFSTHEGVAVMFHHDEVTINNKPFVSEESYKPNSLAETDLSCGTILLTDIEFSMRLNSC